MNTWRTNRVNAEAVMAFLAGLFILSSCSGLRELAQTAGVKRPAVEVVGADITGLSFDRVDMMFDIRITNPNAVGITLAGFDYDFLINEKSFVRGDQTDGMEIKARGDHLVHLPVSLGFSNIYQTLTGLKDEDTSTYELSCGFAFDLPVLGPVRVPVSTSGDIPMIKLPSVSLDGVRLKNLGITGADLELGVKLVNPNAFSMLLETFSYQFLVGGQQWASGSADHHTEITEKGENLLTFPISLNFLQVGQSVYQMLRGDEDLEYELKGDVDVSSALSQLAKAQLDFGTSGVTRLLR